MEIKIEILTRDSEYIKTVINWLYSEWGNNNPNFWESWVRSSLSSDQVPMTFIALIDDKPAGTISLWNCDIQSRQDLRPWVGGLYVAEEFRGHTYTAGKLGLLLQKHALWALKELGYQAAYAFTEKTTDYYERIDWEPIGTTYDENDEQIRLLKMDLKEWGAKEKHRL